MFSRNEITGNDAAPSRQCYPWQEMEEYQPDGGMWSIASPRDAGRFAAQAAALMAVPPAFADAMRRALTEWPRSVGVALTAPGMNHRAWLGHAGCYLATGSPEESTRIGWHQLDDAEQYGANAAADTVIHEWRKAQAARVGYYGMEGLWDA